MKRALFMVATILSPVPLNAQDDCFPARGSNEAATFAILAVPLAFGRGGMPSAEGWSAGLELAVLPKVPDATATPTTCRPGKGPENTDLLPVLPRPRVGIPLPGRFHLEASWVPPLRVRGVKANLLGLALQRSVELGSRALSVRVHTTLGVVHAPITCNEDALNDPASECLDGTLSDDSYRPNVFGIDAATEWRRGTSLRPYAGLGYNHLRPRFQVNFTNSAGDTDRRKVSVDLDRIVLFGGTTWDARPGLSVGSEVYLSPQDAFTLRVVARHRM